MWGLPIQAHRYLIEPLGGTHAQNLIYSRYVKFLQSIREGRKTAPYYLLEKIKDNTNTITGKNIAHIFGNNKVDIFNINLSKFKKSLEFSHSDENNIWKINSIKELTNIKKGIMTVEFNNGETLKYEEIEELVHYIATL